MPLPVLSWKVSILLLIAKSVTLHLFSGMKEKIVRIATKIFTTKRLEKIVRNAIRQKPGK
jgi:hypothetical protein